MNNLETLKQELLTQKAVIEEMGGAVTVANTNPSPSEITQGIKTIGNSTDFSKATATEQDVMQGKTFYAGNNELKTGQLSLYNLKTEIKYIFEYDENAPYSAQRYSYEINPEVTTLRIGLARANPNYIDVYFHNGITEIGNYAFMDTPNFRYFNFSEMDNLKTIGAYAFENSNSETLDFAALPKNVEVINQRAFYNILKEGDSIVLPSSVTTMQQHCFYMVNRVNINSFVVPADAVLNTLSTYTLYNVGCRCDLNAPSITSISSRFNYNGSFNNIVLSENFTTMGDKCFSADTTRPVSDCWLQTVTYLGETPPSIPTEPYAPQAVQNGLKIYVPDQSIEAYKAKFSSRYTSCILPMSQKP